MVILFQLQGEDKMNKKEMVRICIETANEQIKKQHGYDLEEVYMFADAVRRIRTKNDEKMLSQINYLVEQNGKIKLKLKQYLDTHEENGVVYLPKYEVERILDGDFDEQN